MNDNLKEAADIIKVSRNCIAFTGAGISVESGIPDFRSAGGLWDKYDPSIYANIESFIKDPEMVWDMIFEMINVTVSAEPNDAHKSLARLEELGLLKGIVTQNIDNLHQRGGSKNVIDFHGNSAQLECIKCQNTYNTEHFLVENNEIPYCLNCRAILKPSVIFFGEIISDLALVKSSEMAEKADVVLVIGTSAIVYPAASIPITAKRKGAKIIEVNIEETELSIGISDIVLQGKAGEIMPQLLQLIEEK
jgi:NAD-dependent deacetylase